MDSLLVLWVFLALAVVVFLIAQLRKARTERRGDVADAHRALRDLMAREPVEGPDAKPWHERRTTKPFPEYRSQRWTNWHFHDPENRGILTLPEICVGTVFPDD